MSRQRPSTAIGRVIGPGTGGGYRVEIDGAEYDGAPAIGNLAEGDLPPVIFGLPDSRRMPLLLGGTGANLELPLSFFSHAVLVAQLQWARAGQSEQGDMDTGNREGSGMGGGPEEWQLPAFWTLLTEGNPVNCIRAAFNKTWWLEKISVWRLRRARLTETLSEGPDSLSDWEMLEIDSDWSPLSMAIEQVVEASEEEPGVMDFYVSWESESEFHLSKHRYHEQTLSLESLWVRQLAYKPIGESFRVGSSCWQILGQDIGEGTLKLWASKVDDATGALLATTPLPLDAATTIEDTVDIGDAAGIVPVIDTNSQFGDDFEAHWGAVEHGGKLRDFLIWRSDPDDIGEDSYVIPRWSRSPQMVAWRFSSIGVSTAWKIQGWNQSGKYEFYSTCTLDPRKGQNQLLVHYSRVGWTSLSNLVRHWKYLLGFWDLENFMPDLGDPTREQVDPATWGGWPLSTSSTTDTNPGTGHTNWSTWFDNANTFLGPQSSDTWELVNTDFAEQIRIHGYQVIHPKTGVVARENCVKADQTSGSLAGEGVVVEWFESEWVPPATDPRDVEDEYGTVILDEGGYGFIEPLADGESEFFKKVWVIIASDWPPESEEWRFRWDWSTPAAPSFGNTFIRMANGDPHGTPPDDFPDGDFTTIPGRKFISLRIKQGSVAYDTAESAEVNWHTCEFCCTGDRAHGRTKPL